MISEWVVLSFYIENGQRTTLQTIAPELFKGIYSSVYHTAITVTSKLSTPVVLGALSEELDKKAHAFVTRSLAENYT